MTLNAADDFSADDHEIMASLGLDHDEEASQQAGDAPSEQTATAPKDRPASTEVATAPADEKPADPKPTDGHPAVEADQEPKGNVTQALRASRRAERRAREEAERLKAQVAELQAKAPPPAGQDDSDIEAIAEDFPAAAELIRKERAARREAEDRAASATKAATRETAPEFEPMQFPDDVQDIVDSVPELQSWQYDPAKKAEFAMACSIDDLLAKHPKWSGKPMAERLAEAVRRTKAELVPEQSLQDNATAKARERIVNAPKAMPETLSDLGGTTPTKDTANLGRFMALKSDEDILAELDRT